jgi:5-formyltetrahydrofolate cyclo-ligase
MTDLRPLRQQLRAARRGLGERERRLAAEQALQRIRSMRQFRNAGRIALYRGVDGELCPLPLAEHALSLGKTICLPVLHPFLHGRLLFCRWRPGEPMRRNRFGIEEPVPTGRNIIPASHLDLVVMPLLGFDPQCHRIGMGGGFYDRTFAFRRQRRILRSPCLVGFAHELQRLATIEQRPWDIQLDAVATNTTLYRASSRVVSD